MQSNGKAAESELRFAIMAGGNGRRLWDLTGRRGKPKALAPLDDGSILERIIKDVIRCKSKPSIEVWMQEQHHRYRTVVSQFLRKRFSDQEIRVRAETTPSTGSALKRICLGTKGDTGTVICYSDIVVPKGSISKFLDRCNAAGSLDLLIAVTELGYGSLNTRVQISRKTGKASLEVYKSKSSGKAEAELSSDRKSYVGLVYVSHSAARALKSYDLRTHGSASRALNEVAARVSNVDVFYLPWSVNVNTQADHRLALELIGAEGHV